MKLLAPGSQKPFLRSGGEKWVSIRVISLEYELICNDDDKMASSTAKTYFKIATSIYIRFLLWPGGSTLHKAV